MIPIYVYTQGTKLPEEGTYYILAQNGTYLRKDTGIVRAMVKVERISILEPIIPKAEINIPLIPAEFLVRTLLFFKRVYKVHRSEAAILLHYNPESKEFYLHCPEQKVSGGGVSYDSSERFEGHLLVGTIHSHCDFNAFHSGVDIHDEMNFDGIHITLGHVDHPYFSTSCSVVVNDNRFKIDPEIVIVGIQKVDWQPPKIVSFPRRTFTVRRQVPRALNSEEPENEFLPTVFFDNPIGFFQTYHKPEVIQYYNMSLPDGKDYRHVGFPRSWMDKVSHELGFVAAVKNIFESKPEENTAEDLYEGAVI